VRAIVENSGIGEGAGGPTDRGDIGAGVEQLLGLVQHGVVLRLAPGVRPREQKHGRVLGAHVADQDLGSDLHAAHGRDRLRADTHGADRNASPWLTEEPAGVELGNGVAGLPVRECVEHIQVGEPLHGRPQLRTP
jgi:hypothetical protein